MNPQLGRIFRRKFPPRRSNIGVIIAANERGQAEIDWWSPWRYAGTARNASRPVRSMLHGVAHQGGLVVGALAGEALEGGFSLLGALF